MYFADLTPYEYDGNEPNNNIVNVGWLSRDFTFIKGFSDNAFIEHIKNLVEHPTNLYRGMHLCEFCPEPQTIYNNGMKSMLLVPETAGNGEIRIKDSNGITYVAPVLIYHYIVAHGYLPPKQFVLAVSSSGTDV
jgi:hypothetical protein